MALYLGLDTSNYTTSAAVYDSTTNRICMVKQLLPVKAGSIGLKQSDAVFHHVKQMPPLLEQLLQEIPAPLDGVGVSTTPRRQEGSYMPCFLVGELTASAIATANRIPKQTFSHQEGHVMAALYSADRLDLIKQPFYAFHVSGGTTECLSVTYRAGRFDIDLLAASLDLKAGQAIDRVGVMLGLPFPAGPHLEQLAAQETEPIRVKPCLKGADCSLSGLQNQCQKLFEDGKTAKYIAKYAITYVMQTLSCMTEAVLQQHGKRPIIYAGGVMSNAMIRDCFTKRFDGIFARPEYASDNSAGIAVMTAAAIEREAIAFWPANAE